MPTLLGIISVEQEQSFFAERYFREIITVASQTVAGNDCYLRIMPPLPAVADPATLHAQLIGQVIAATLVIAPDEALLGQLYLLARLAGVERDLYQHVLPTRPIVRESSGARHG